jgi:hypothetical protein
VVEGQGVVLAVGVDPERAVVAAVDSEAIAVEEELAAVAQALAVGQASAGQVVEVERVVGVDQERAAVDSEAVAVEEELAEVA